MARTKPLLLALVWIACVAVQSAIAGPNHYRVVLSQANSDVISVEAELELESDTIGMLITSSDLANGQADLLDALEVVDGDGNAFALEALGQGDWRVVGATAGQRVRVTYQIRLEHDLHQWGPGIDEVAYRNDDGLFFTGGSLFVVPGFEMADGARVRFELPEGWKASLPWNLDAATGEAVATSAMDLVRNCLFLGTHLEETVQLGDFTFTMAIGGELKPHSQLFVDAMTPILPAALDTFGGMPGSNRYLVVFNQGSRNDGGAFGASYSMLISGTVNQASSVVWGHGIAHELIHFWNGHTITPASTQEEWFKEGFTDYLTILLRSRSGLDPREQTYRKLENSMRRYILSRRLLGIEDNLRDAGEQKHKNRMLVYGGGTLVGFALDVRMREASGNAVGIDDLFAAMYAEFSSGVTYELEDIGRIASDLCGEDQSEFFADYVQGTQFLDVGPYVYAMGLQVDTVMDEFYLSERVDATPSEQAIAAAMLGTTHDQPPH